MPHGNKGKILHVGLTNGQLTVDGPDETVCRKYLGARAVWMHDILREMPKG